MDLYTVVPALHSPPSSSNVIPDGTLDVLNGQFDGWEVGIPNKLGCVRRRVHEALVWVVPACLGGTHDWRSCHVWQVCPAGVPDLHVDDAALSMNSTCNLLPACLLLLDEKPRNSRHGVALELKRQRQITAGIVKVLTSIQFQMRLPACQHTVFIAESRKSCNDRQTVPKRCAYLDRWRHPFRDNEAPFSGTLRVVLGHQVIGKPDAVGSFHGALRIGSPLFLVNGAWTIQ